MESRLLASVIIVGAALVLIALERLRPYERAPLFRSGFFDDFVMYSLVQGAVLGFVIHAFIGWLDSASGLSRLRLVSDWSLGTQCLVFLVTHDLYIYWFHRLQHRHPVLWRLHEAHHSVRHVDWVAGSRSHALEIVLNQTVEFAPIVLLGAAPEVALFKGVVDAVWGMWIHANIDVRLGRLGALLNGPELHRWHHASELGRQGCNYATKFALWDRMFGTAYRSDCKKPAGYGLGYSGFPERYFEQQLHLFRRQRRRSMEEPE